MIVDDYIELVPSSNRSRPKFIQMLKDSLAPIVAGQNCLESMSSEFDLDVAVGAQLDVVGEWVGISRKIVTPLENIWFSLDIAGLGIGEAPILGPFDSDTGLTTLDDDMYRKLLRARIAINNWDGTVASAQVALDTFLDATDTIVFYDDRGDLSASIAISGKMPSLLLLVILAGDYLPLKPGGTPVDYLITSVDEVPCFGLGANNDVIGGLGFGAMSNPISDMLTI